MGRKVNFARGEIPSRGKTRRKCIYSVAAQKTAKHRAKFGWPTLNDVAPLTKPRPAEICWGAPNSEPFSAASGPKLAILWDSAGDIAAQHFFPIGDTCLIMVALWNRADHYIFALWFLLFFFFFFLA